jgi:hypothetical protein
MQSVDTPINTMAVLLAMRGFAASINAQSELSVRLGYDAHIEVSLEGTDTVAGTLYAGRDWETNAATVEEELFYTTDFAEALRVIFRVAESMTEKEY